MFFAVLWLLGASVSSGTTTAAAESRSKLVSEVQVESWIQSWQHRLHLDEWRINVRMVRATELKPDTLGNLKWNITNHTADIKVLSPIDYEIAPADIPEDIEYTVVHELVHLQLSVLPRDMGKKDVEENVVNRISDALMSLDKGDSFRARSAPSPRIPKVPGDTSKDPEVARKNVN
jgi:hypothetical protein